MVIDVRPDGDANQEEEDRRWTGLRARDTLSVGKAVGVGGPAIGPFRPHLGSRFTPCVVQCVARWDGLICLRRFDQGFQVRAGAEEINSKTVTGTHTADEGGWGVCSADILRPAR